MNSLRDRVANLEARSRKFTEKEWEEFCARQGWTPEFLRSVIEEALRTVGPDDPAAQLFRDAIAQLEAPNATG